MGLHTWVGLQQCDFRFDLYFSFRFSFPIIFSFSFVLVFVNENYTGLQHLARATTTSDTPCFVSVYCAPAAAQ